MASPPPTILKAAARRVLRSSLPDIGPAAEESKAVREALLPWLKAGGWKTVAAFAALPGEVDLLPLLDRLTGLHWALPRVEGTDLIFHSIRDAGDLQTGSYGISEPSADAPVIALEAIDVFLCPGLGFTATGIRMGRGKGFYDRALPLAKPGTVLVGVTFESQIVPDLPSEAHDLRMHLLATQAGVFVCRREDQGSA